MAGTARKIRVVRVAIEMLGLVHQRASQSHIDATSTRVSGYASRAAAKIRLGYLDEHVCLATLREIDAHSLTTRNGKGLQNGSHLQYEQ